ncbi:hypothetical protein Tco_0032720 [Tanacetum coccineum]
MIVTIPHNICNLVVTKLDSIEKLVNEIGELRIISSHVLWASGVQIPQNNLDNLRSTEEEEDGATKDHKISQVYDNATDDRHHINVISCSKLHGHGCVTVLSPKVALYHTYRTDSITLVHLSDVTSTPLNTSTPILSLPYRLRLSQTTPPTQYTVQHVRPPPYLYCIGLSVRPDLARLLRLSLTTSPLANSLSYGVGLHISFSRVVKELGGNVDGGGKGESEERLIKPNLGKIAEVPCWGRHWVLGCCSRSLDGSSYEEKDSRLEAELHLFVETGYVLSVIPKVDCRKISRRRLWWLLRRKCGAVSTSACVSAVAFVKEICCVAADWGNAIGRLVVISQRQHGRMILEFVENGPLIWPTIKVNGVTRLKKYSKLSATEVIQADCDIKATNIILQGLLPEVYAFVSNHKVAKEL